MKILRIVTTLIIAITILSSCSNLTSSECPPNTIIEWVDMLMINDINFQHDFVEEPSNLTFEKGTALGEVQYKMADNACSNHHMNNGDAAYLDVGTIIYEVKGFPSTLVVLADEKIYIVDQNEKAKTIHDLYPIEGLVKDIHFQSTENGQRIHTFSTSSKETFLKDWLPLKLVDSEMLHDKNTFEGERVFLEIELENSVSFRIVYWSDSNTFSFGAVGNDQIAQIIELEKSLIAQ